MIYCIGDIHGNVIALNSLVMKVPFLNEDTIVFLGDYIDRGPDSKQVLNYLISFSKVFGCKTIFLKGNHEQMYLDYESGIFADIWLGNGGYATMKSYDYISGDTWDFRMPKEHVDFLCKLHLYYETDDYFFVHAGIDPRKPIEKQTEDNFLWIRDLFINSEHKLDKTIVYGHTPTISFKPRMQTKKIGLDTGLAFKGKLTCMRFPDLEYWQV